LQRKFGNNNLKYADDWLSDDFVEHQVFSGTMPATGKAFEMEAIYIVRINDEGQMAEHWGVVNTIGTMGQLGLLPF
jgi:hypothetical protein